MSQYVPNVLSLRGERTHSTFWTYSEYARDVLFSYTVVYKNEGAPTTVETPSTTFMKTLAICLLYDNLLVVVNIYTLLGWLACKLVTIECEPHILI